MGSELPSKYSSKGLSLADSKKVITTGTPRQNRPIGAIKIEERVNNVLEQRTLNGQQDNDGDVEMIQIDDEQEVQIIANYVTDERRNNHLDNLGWQANLDELDMEGLSPEPVPARETLMVADTNFILSHLDIVDSLSKLHVKYHHKIVIPNTVLRELDGLKGSKEATKETVIDGTTIGHLARWANTWIYQKLADLDSAVRGQKLREVLDRNSRKDDAILDCCLYLKERENALVILLSNDKNLCMKALTNEILTVSYRKGMTAELISTMAFQENQAQTGIPVNLSPRKQASSPHPYEAQNELQTVNQSQVSFGDSQMEYEVTEVPISNQESRTGPSPRLNIKNIHEAAEQIYSEVQMVMLNAIDYCMFAEYGEDMDIIGYDKTKVRTLSDSAQVLIKFWISVFTDYFRQSRFKPFNSRGKKVPQKVAMPRDGCELSEFVSYWSEVLRALYTKRDAHQNNALEQIITRWVNIATHFDKQSLDTK